MTVGQAICEQVHTRSAHHVDETWRYCLSVRIYALRRTSIGKVADRNNPVTLDSEVRPTGLCSGAVNDRAADDDDVERGSRGAGDKRHRRSGGQQNDE
jgi:hypothetical protein